MSFKPKSAYFVSAFFIFNTFSNMIRYIFTCLIIFIATIGYAQKKMILIQSDFGLKDGAVAEMKGVAMSIDETLKIFDLTHEIPAYNIWQAAYRLNQTLPYWPAGTIAVSIVDPGVGTNRKSIVAKTKKGHYIVTPDNGTITLIAETEDIEAVREIDESINRRSGSDKSYTFHGRDVYVFTAAKLASGAITFEQVGPLLNDFQKINYPICRIENGILKGNIPALDVQYGNVWTNISSKYFDQLQVKKGDLMQVFIRYNNEQAYTGKMPYCSSFGNVKKGQPLLYINSLMQVSLALNQGDFSKTYHIDCGAEWDIEIRKVNQ
jgi:S-adenosylmethionine hydrolase